MTPKQFAMYMTLFKGDLNSMSKKQVKKLMAYITEYQGERFVKRFSREVKHGKSKQ